MRPARSPDSIANGGLGGVILFSRDQLTGGVRNVESPEQLERLVADLRALAPDRTLLVAIDQEGGRVARLTPETGFPASPARRRSPPRATTRSPRGPSRSPRRFVCRDQRQPGAGRRPQREPGQPRDRRARAVVLGRPRRRRQRRRDRDPGPPGRGRPNGAEALPGTRVGDREHRLRGGRRDRTWSPTELEPTAR